jgi:hypothetical protein
MVFSVSEVPVGTICFSDSGIVAVSAAATGDTSRVVGAEVSTVCKNEHERMDKAIAINGNNRFKNLINYTP